MKKRINVFVRFLCGFIEVEAEEFNDSFWIYSCKWKNNQWIKEKYSVYDYALIDKKTGLHIAYSDSLKEIKDVELTMKKLKDYIKTYKENYSILVDRYNKLLTEKYSTNEGISEGKNES